MNFHTFRYSVLTRVVIIVASLFLLSSCFSEYSEHFIAEHSQSRVVSWEYRISLGSDNLWILPDRGRKDAIIESIRNAKERVLMEIYMWTDKDIMNAMIDAHKRWVDVRVLLERNVYDLPRVNVPLFSALEKSWIPVKYTDSYRFTFTHAKFWIIDDIYFISTGNLTKSFFESNRDFVYSSSDTQSLDFLTELFFWDFSYLWVDRSKIPNHIVLSPVDARAKIEYLLEHAQHDIKIYTQTLADNRIIELLQKKDTEWVNVEVCTADNESNRESSSWSTLDWVYIKKPYLHGKIILVDDVYIFLWSQNLTSNSLENNREVGLILTDSWTIYTELSQYFRKDCIFE